MTKQREKVREEFEKEFGAFAIMGKAGRFYNGAFANEARISKAVEWIENKIDQAHSAGVEEERERIAKQAVQYGGITSSWKPTLLELIRALPPKDKKDLLASLQTNKGEK